MPLVQVIIDDSTDKTITGVHVYDRDNGGTFIGAAGSTFPATPEAGEWFWRTDEARLYRRNSANTAWDSVVASLVHHASTHEDGGSDEINVTGLSGTLADDQPPAAHAIDGAKHTGQLSHTSLTNIGVLTHTQLDDHVSDTSNPHNVTASQVGAAPAIHHTQHELGGTDVIPHQNLQGHGTYDHEDIDKHINDDTHNPHKVVEPQCWKYASSATDPTTPAPVDGDRYYNTNLEMWMFYSGSRSKWLSIETATFQFGRNGICDF
jgi:hypothetical protein